MDTLTPRMVLFVEEYSRSGKGRQAAIHAGWPAARADLRRNTMLRYPEVQAALVARRDLRFQAIEDEGQCILAETARVAFADLRCLFDSKGRLQPIHRLDESARGLDENALAAFRIYDPLARPRGKVLRIRRIGKPAALRMLMKHLRMWGEPAEDGAAAGLAEDLAPIRMPTPVQAGRSLAASFSRRQRFAAEYTIDFNGRAASLRAGFPPSTGGLLQAELLKGADVQNAIARRLRGRFERVGLTPARVLHQVRCIAHSNLERLHRPDGSYRSVNEIDDDALASIHWIDLDTDRHTVLRVRRLDKVNALDLLGRHNGLWGRRKGPAADEAGLNAAMAEGLKRAP